MGEHALRIQNAMAEQYERSAEMGMIQSGISCAVPSQVLWAHLDFY